MVTRIWIPSPNYSSSRSRSQILCVHTSEGASTFRSLGNFLAQPSAGVSYHVGFDDTTSAEIGEYVAHNRKSWSALEANNWGLHGCCCTPSGASSGWSRDTWLSKPRMLDACKAWLQEESARYGIPLVKIDSNQVSAGVAGVCGHADVSPLTGGGHTDPGPNFPWDRVVSGTPVPPPSGGGGGAAPGGPAPAFPYPAGHYLGQPDPDPHCHSGFYGGVDTQNVTTWQAQMAARGWAIGVDGQYGPQSEDVARSFQAEKGLAVDGLVGPQTWSTSWTAPVT